jgi:Immunity protein 35
MLSFLLLLFMIDPQDAPRPIDKARALEIAQKAATELGDHDFVILDEHTVERPFGWVFFYVPRQYLRTGDINDLVPGSAPLVVHRADGSVKHLGTATPPAREIETYEKQWREKHPETKTPPK